MGRASQLLQFCNAAADAELIFFHDGEGEESVRWQTIAGRPARPYVRLC